MSKNLKIKPRLIIPTLFLISFSTASIALQCPTMNEIQTGHLRQWQALNTNNDEPIRADIAIKFFQQHGSHFWLAQWVKDLPLQGQCYYCIDKGCGYAEIYFSQTVPNPPQGKAWHQGSAVWQCKISDVNACAFTDNLDAKKFSPFTFTAGN